MSKGFIKTSEAIIAVLLVFTLFSYLAERISAPLFEIEKDTTNIQDSVLDMIFNEMKNDLKTCDLNRVQYLTEAFKPGDMDSKMEITQISNVKISADHNITVQNISLTYNFPDYTDRLSVLSYSQLKNFPCRVNWVWYRVPIIIQNSLVSRKNYDILFTNVNLSKPDVINDSLSFYWKNSETLINLSGFADYGNYSLANVSVRIPSIVAGESGTGYLVFAVNNTYFSQEFVELGSNSIDYVVMGVEDLNRGDVLIQLSNFNESQTVYLEYRLGSEVNRTYPLVSSINNTGITTTIYWDELKPCTTFRYEQPPVSTFFNTKKVFYYDTSTIILNLQMWYPWV
jgi:hypothetical protein